MHAAPPRRPLTAPSVLVVHASAELYGADRALLELLAGLRERGQRAHVVLPARNDRARQDAEDAPIGPEEEAEGDHAAVLKHVQHVAVRGDVQRARVLDEDLAGAIQVCTSPDR